ncbi:MAG TPA: hypothetical protein VMI56_27550 [Reyranella sp.]|nr:hypothetical protein [Reyranella sp.]
MHFNSPLRRWGRALGIGSEKFPLGPRRVEFINPRPEQEKAVAKNNILAKYARPVTSQDGEEGVLRHIVETLGISEGWCVEFGAWDGTRDSNVRDLIHTSGWHAVLIEPHSAAFARLVETYRDRPDVHCLHGFVGFEGDIALDALLARTPIPTSFDLMVIDVDGDDWHIWEACTRYRAKVVMIEINPFCPTDLPFVKEKGAPGLGAASLRSVCELGKAKGYELVCAMGNNAILVEREYFARFAIPDNRPEAMFASYAFTRLFQGYDGTLHFAGNHELIWRHQKDEAGRIGRVQVADEDIQPLPKGLRVFRPRLTYDNPFLAEQAGKIDRARVPSNRLLEHQANRTSECGEDGILAHIFGVLGEGGRTCVDVGANDGVAFSNTHTLLEERGWSGTLIDKDADAVARLRTLYQGKAGIRIEQAEVRSRGPNSIDALLSRAGAPRDIDLLCIDIEGNDYHLWASLRRRPRVVVIDFNPTVPNDVLLVQQDDPTVHDGASLRALIELGQAMGYELAAATSWNAIFVRADLFGQLGVTDNTIDRMYYPVFETRAFFSINSYMSIAGCNRLFRHNYVFQADAIQPIPPDLRNLPFQEGPGEPVISTFF